jgi:hypothetical protein
MGIELYWDNEERTIMLLEFEGRWTWDDLFDTLAKAKKVSAKAAYEIGAIVNISGGVRFPGGSLLNAQSFENAKKLLAMSDGTAGPVVIAGSNPMIRTAFETMSRLSPGSTANIHFAPDLDAARRYLNERLRLAQEAAS